MQDRMRELVDILNKYAYEYYVMDNPTVADVEYDRLYDELVALEKSTGVTLVDSPTKRVGGELIKEFSPYTHRHRLYSLDKVQSIDEFRAWQDKIEKALGYMPECSIEYKFDGLTINLTYENGVLVTAATRGNGVQGEEVFEQVKTIKSVPLTIPFNGVCEVQGEGIMRLSVLEEYNKTAKEPLKNARNGVAGAIRNLDPKETAKRKLDIMCYNVGYIEGERFETQHEMIDFLARNKFKISDFTRYTSNKEEMVDAINEVENRRPDLDFLIDGAVIKICDLGIREKLGYTEKFPRWAIAYKYKAEEVTTTVKDVIWQVSRTGKLNPLALVEPVELGGARVSRATLNNYGDILRKDIKIGSRVFIRRSNDVIPEILGIAEHTKDSRDIEKPTVCPFCGGEVVEDGAFLRCTNVEHCAPRRISMIAHYASKDAVDIDGLSDKTIELLYNTTNMRDICDIYRLKAEDLVGLDSFKDKKISNLISAIDRRRTVPLDRFLYGIGIMNIGKKSSRELAEKFVSLESVMNSSREEILTIPDFGEVMADSVVSFFEDETNRAMIDSLRELGVTVEDMKVNEGIFTGYNVVLTGSLTSLKRSEAEAIIVARGGKTASSVSKSVNLVIAGAEAGSKLDKANKLGIKVISEQDFLDMLK